MKSFILRIENWLLIISAILLIVEELFFGKSVVDLHFHDTYFIISRFHIGIVMLVIVLVACLCHFLLRLQHKRNKTVLTSHVIATIILLLFLFIAVKQDTGAARRYYDFSSWEAFQYFGRLNYYLAIAFLAFLIIQLLFVLYTIVRVVIKNGFVQTTTLK